MLRLIVLSLSLSISTLISAAERADLDALLAQSRTQTEGVWILAKPVALSAPARMGEPPKPGKTRYMQETLALIGGAPAPEINHKMWLATPRGARLMVYLSAATAKRVQDARLAPGTPLLIHATQYWEYHLGPGLLLTGFEIQP